MEELLAALPELTEAVRSARDAHAGLIPQITQLVSAISPSTIFAFNYEMRNLAATVGSALEPALHALIAVVQEAAGAIYPAMQALAPVFEKITDILGGTFVAVLDTLVAAFNALAPVIDIIVTLMGFFHAYLKFALSVIGGLFTIISVPIKLFAAILEPLVAIVKVFGDYLNVLGDILRATFSAIGESISGLFSFMKPVAEAVTNALGNLAKSMILWTARMAASLSFLFGSNFIDRLIAGLEPRRGAVAAPSNVGISSPAQIANLVAQSAFVASGNDRQRETNEWLEDILGELRRIRGQSSSGERAGGTAYDLFRVNSLDPFVGLYRLLTTGRI